jgi:hypothetical protein
MTTNQSEEKSFKIYTTEHKGYSVKAKSVREALDIFEQADLTPKDNRVEFYECGDFKIEGILDGSEWIKFDELEDELEEEEEEEGGE